MDEGEGRLGPGVVVPRRIHWNAGHEVNIPAQGAEGCRFGGS